MRFVWCLAVIFIASMLCFAQEMRVQIVTFQNGDLALKGFLYQPAQGNGPWAAIVYNHGSEKNLAYIDKLALPFVQQGYVFFAPNRRGQGRSPGPYISDQLGTLKGAQWSQMLVKLHEEQLSDQLTGLAYLERLSFVDSNKIGVFGWSFGGIQTILGVAESSRYQAAVHCAGAAQTWDTSPELRERLLRAARSAKAPVFFLQAENDYSLTAQAALSDEMNKFGKLNQVKIFPAFGSSQQDGHEFCAKGSDVWGSEVFSFFAKYLK